MPHPATSCDQLLAAQTRIVRCASMDQQLRNQHLLRPDGSSPAGVYWGYALLSILLPQNFRSSLHRDFKLVAAEIAEADARR